MVPVASGQERSSVSKAPAIGGLAPLPWREGARLPCVKALDYVPAGWRAEIRELPGRNGMAQRALASTE